MAQSDGEIYGGVKFPVVPKPKTAIARAYQSAPRITAPYVPPAPRAPTYTAPPAPTPAYVPPAPRVPTYTPRPTPAYVPPQPPQVSYPPPQTTPYAAAPGIGATARTLFDTLRGTLGMLEQDTGQQGLGAVTETLRRYGPDVPGLALQQAGQGIVNQIGRRVEQVGDWAERTLAPETRAKIGAVGEDVGGALLKVGTALNVPYEKIAEPFIAQAWGNVNTPEYQALQQRKQDLDTQAVELRRLGRFDEQARTEAQAQQVQQQMTALAAAQNPRNPAYQARIAEEERPTLTDAWERVYGADRDANVAQYRAQATPAQQLVLAVLLDPLNVVDIAGGGVVDAVRLAKARRAFVPTTKTVAEVGQELAQAGARGNNLIGRLTPFRLTNESLATALTTRATDMTSRLVELGDESLFIKAVTDPDAPDIVAATGGLSQTVAWKQTAALTQKALGDDPTQGIIEIMGAAQGDPTELVAALADNYASAARSLFPAPAKGPLTKARDFTRDWLSTLYMGYSPGYAARNFMGNTSTAFMDGVSPFQTRATVAKVQSRWGVMPVETRQGIGAAGEGAKGVKATGAAAAVQIPPLGISDLTKGMTAKGPMLTVAQNTEQLQSQAIVTNSLLRWWPDVWGKRVSTQLTPKLQAIGLDASQVQYYSREIGSAWNVDELRKLGRSVTPPASAAPVSPAPLPSVPPGIPPSGAPVAAPPGVPPSGWGSVVGPRQNIYTSPAPVVGTSAGGVVPPPSGAPSGVASSPPQTAAPSPAAIVANLPDEVDVTQLSPEELTALTRALSGKGVPETVMPDLARTVPPEQLRQLADVTGDPGLPQAVQEAVRRAETPQQAAAAVDVIEQTHTVAVRTEQTLAEFDRVAQTVNPQEALAFLDEIAQLEGEARRALQDAREAVRTALQGQPPAQAAPLWQQFTEAAGQAEARIATAAEDVRRLTPTAANSRYELFSDVANGKVDFAVQAAHKLGYGGEGSFFPQAGRSSHAANAWAKHVGKDVKPPATNLEFAELAEKNPAAVDRWTRYLAEKAEQRGINVGTPEQFIQGAPSRHRDNIRAFEPPDDVARAEAAGILPPEPLEAGRVPGAVTPPAAPAPAPSVAPAAPATVAELTQEVQQYTNPTVRVADIKADPARFQFKEAAKSTKTGTTAQFANQKTWRPELGKGVSLWVDPADNQTYIVNGHHRLEMAQRLGAETIESPYYIQAPTSKEAYMIGALQNIAEGRGTPVDAAEIFKQAGMGPAVLADAGLSLSKGNVRKGLALANLNDTLYRSVVNKQFPIERAVIIGEKLPDADLQLQLVRELDKQLAKGRKITDDMVSELAEAMAGGPTTTYEQAGLFGVEAITQSNAFERADFLAYVRERLRSEKRLFGFAAQKSAELARVGNIDRAAAQGISQDAEGLLNLFDTVKNQRGPISDLANEAAQELAKGNTNAKATYYARLVEALPNSFQRQGPATAGDIAGAGARGFGAGPETLDYTRQTGPGLFDVGITGPGTQQAQAAMSNIQAAFQSVRSSIGTSQPVTPLSPQQAAQLRQLIEREAVGAMVKDKAIVGNLATTIRNFVLGDYSRRRNALDWLSYIYPYPTWYGFTYWNWAQRLATHPSVLANFARYRQAVNTANTEWYRDVTGDPNATLPPQYENVIRLGDPNNPLLINLERSLSPLNALTEDFTSRVRQAAPGGALVEKLGQYGPTLYGPYIWAYAAWLKSQGYDEAAQEWFGYLSSTTKAVKSGTALYKEAGLPGSDLIPSGGFAPEQLIPGNNVQGGDIYEKRRVRNYLAEMYQRGEISLEDMQTAIYTASGPVWDRALQAEAVGNAPRNLASWGAGLSINQFTPRDADIARMRAAQDRLDQMQLTMPPEQYELAKRDFEAKYPWARTYQAGYYSPDPQKRLDDYAGLVLDRLPPGRERQALLTAVGLTAALVAKFYDGGFTTAGMTPEEQAQFQQGIEKLGGTVPVPDAQTEYNQTIAAQWHNRMLEQAAGQVRTQGFNFSLDELRAIESGYFEAADPAAYLAQHPELKAYWDAKREVTRNGLNPKLPGLLQDAGIGEGELPGFMAGQPGVPGAELQASADQYYTSEKDLEARKQFGDDILDLQSEYMSLDKAGRAAWRRAHPEEFARLADYWDWQREQNGEEPYQSSRSSGGSSYRRSYSRNYYPRSYRSYRSYGGGYGGGGGAALPGATPVATELLGPDGTLGFSTSTLEGFNELYALVRAIDPAFDQLVMLLFGNGIADLMKSWYAMTPEQRATWQAAHPDEYARLVRFWGWLTTQKDAGTTGRGTPFARQLESMPPGAPLMPPPVPSQPTPALPALPPVVPPIM